MSVLGTIAVRLCSASCAVSRRRPCAGLEHGVAIAARQRGLGDGEPEVRGEIGAGAPREQRARDLRGALEVAEAGGGRDALDVRHGRRGVDGDGALERRELVLDAAGGSVTRGGADERVGGDADPTKGSRYAATTRGDRLAERFEDDFGALHQGPGLAVQTLTLAGEALGHFTGAVGGLVL